MAGRLPKRFVVELPQGNHKGRPTQTCLPGLGRAWQAGPLPAMAYTRCCK